eukprot:m.287762 g.287762  ORF g.287762 m.287762 type:complete len:88 (-) comp19953_c0_seq3:205-468(-)
MMLYPCACLYRSCTQGISALMLTAAYSCPTRSTIAFAKSRQTAPMWSRWPVEVARKVYRTSIVDGIDNVLLSFLGKEFRMQKDEHDG